ncbi:MAG: AMP-binding protein [Hyphomicrobiaceae bacterium]|nr:AMP-binding protein [Hyphomicrobiaceae bacterium]
MHEILEKLHGFAPVFDGALIFSDRNREVTRSGLAANVFRSATLLSELPDRLGLLCENSVDAAVFQLAGWAAGKVVVPLPWFFSEQQLGHIVQDAGLTHCIASNALRSMAWKLGLTAACTKVPAAALAEPKRGGGQIIYTSGSTGRPKGVRHGLDQITASARLLAEASEATKSDRYLSVLPLPLLLETICAICVPVLTRAQAHFDSEVSARVGRGDPSLIASAFARHQPTTAVMVPELLAVWTEQLGRSRQRAPSSLRFVAVGGAPVSPALSAAARGVGIPVFEGYGLSECCSVVSVNTPKARHAGTSGRPLADVHISIEDGEIVVEGPTVMDGYLNGPDVSGRWHTGDLGEIDADGYLTVHGRKDNLIVTSFGRNVSPEWVESMLLTDRRIAAAAIIGHGEPSLTAILVPTDAGSQWLEHAPRAHVLLSLLTSCRDAPLYAVPSDFLVLTRKQIAERGLMTANGRWRRDALSKIVPELRAERRRRDQTISQPKELIA